MISRKFKDGNLINVHANNVKSTLGVLGILTNSCPQVRKLKIENDEYVDYIVIVVVSLGFNPRHFSHLYIVPSFK